MRKKDFFAQYHTKEWYELSKRIKARDNNTCQMCGRNDKPLSVHHLCYRNGSIFDNSDDELITLCEDCHKEQVQCREEIYELVSDLKTIYTDYELYEMFNTLYHLSVSDGPVNYRPLEPSKRFKNLFVIAEDAYKISNLNSWRKNVRMGEYKSLAISQYKALPCFRSEIEEWFLDNYGEDIKVYIKGEE